MSRLNLGGIQEDDKSDEASRSPSTSPTPSQSSLKVTQYADETNMISPFQWGFRKGISTDVAVGKFMEKVYDGSNGSKFGIGVFLDLEKAFDMVDRSILLEKLGLYGIRGIELELFRSYLSNRKQKVKIFYEEPKLQIERLPLFLQILRFNIGL